MCTGTPRRRADGPAQPAVTGKVAWHVAVTAALLLPLHCRLSSESLHASPGTAVGAAMSAQQAPPCGQLLLRHPALNTAPAAYHHGPLLVPQITAKAPRLCLWQLDLLAAGCIARRQLLDVVDDAAVQGLHLVAVLLLHLQTGSSSDAYIAMCCDDSLHLWCWFTLHVGQVLDGRCCHTEPEALPCSV